MSIIKIENLSKKYLIGQDRTSGSARRGRSLREALSESGQRLLDRMRRPFAPRVQRAEAEEFWALKDIAFEVQAGDRVGIIGRNGAGKSTLLKVLSRITEPTTGRIEIDGRVASLLEVGTGFHQELTGRENIYLNGAIHGMSRAEVREKYDEIVEFSEIGKFLDTPVKRYSSGMYIRLAFSVAAHLEPEILIVDEVLAVGDAAFQSKCLGKMEDVAKTGRTVIFVSHNLGSIETLTKNCIVLDQGRIRFSGPTGDAIQNYLDLVGSVEAGSLASLPRSGDGRIKLTDCYVVDSRDRRTRTAISGEPLSLVFEYEAEDGLDPARASFGFSLDDQRGNRVFVGYNDYMGQPLERLSNRGECRFTFEGLPLTSGRYFVKARVLYAGLEADWPRGVVATVDVVPGDFYKTGRTFHSGQGLLLLRGTWE